MNFLRAAQDWPQRSRKPRIYLAGKIAPRDFRHDLIPGLRGHSWEAGPLACKTFTYLGPFFSSCSHRCSHGPGTHGVLMGPHSCSPDGTTPEEVYERNKEAVFGADLLIAYIDGPECYGTCCEIGWAQARGIPVVMLFSPDINADELWFLRVGTERVPKAIVTRTELPAVFRRLIRTYSK